MSNNKPKEYNDLLIVQLKDKILEAIYQNDNSRIGRILTVIDGCIADPEQRKAIKDLVKGSYWDEQFPGTRFYELNDILSEFDKVSGLNQINTDSFYRIFMNAPTGLRSKDDMDSPRCAKYFNK